MPVDFSTFVFLGLSLTLLPGLLGYGFAITMRFFKLFGGG